MKKGLLSLLPLALFVAFGCNSESQSKQSTSPEQSGTGTKVAKVEDTKTPDATAPPAAVPGATNPAETPPAPPKDSTAPANPEPSLAPPGEVPAGLKSEGYEYSGVAHTKPIDMELTMTNKPGEVTTGSQTVTLKESKDGKAVYNIDRSGGLANLGTEEWTVNKDGVFTTKSSMMNVGDKAMELPADPKPGMTWKVHTTVSQPSEKMDMVITFKIIGKAKVTTKAGSYQDALLVEQDGAGTLQDQKVRTVSQNWYVKGLGLVKANMKTYLPEGKTESLTIQETKSK